MNERTKPILVLGGTGHYGRHIVKSLLAKGQTVRVLSRNSISANKVLGDKVDIVEGDITSRESVTKALQEAKAVIISVSAFSPKLIRKLRLVERDSVLVVLEEAQKAGISRIVYISAYEIREDFLKELGIVWEVPTIKKEIEETLAKSTFNWTILGVAPSMQIFFSMIRGGTMIVPGGGPPALPNVSPRDVGEIAAQVVLRDDLSGKRIRVTGPEAISFPDAARRIGAATGKAVSFRKIPLLPLKTASFVASPFNPYLRHLATAVKLMNNYPQTMTDLIKEDFQWLVSNFEYTPTTLEVEANSQ